MASNYYQFTSKANEDLDNILNYISNVLHNHEAAKNFYHRVLDTIDRICLFPESCPTMDNEYINRKDVRKAVIDSYLLYYVYEIEKSVVTILCITYSGRDTEEILKKLL